MINDLMKIQQDMGSTQQQHSRQQNSPHDGDGARDERYDPNDWVAEVPKFGLYHRGYSTNHWLQVFRPI